MPNVFDENGLQTATRTELVAQFTAAMQAIYGTDINLSSDSPDGQLMNIFVQMALDLEDLLMQIYNTFDPDNAVGNVLDQRVAINGIQRQAGTYTVTPITVVNSQSINLYGLDQDTQTPYTISDAAGNLWELQATELGLAAGSHVLNFQAALPGATITTPNTITIQVTIVLGVTSVNNPTTYTTLGINEESDTALKIRRAKSVSLASQGYLAGLLAALENINGVTSAFVYENLTDSVDSDGVPGHSIWVIVAGSGAPASIAEAIYDKRNAGCGMFGDESYDITQIDGSTFTVYWDNVVVIDLFIAFTATSIDGIVSPNISAIRDGLPDIFIPTVNQEVNINALATYVQQIDANTLVTNAGFSMGLVQILTLSGIAASGSFKLNYNGDISATINWDDSAGTIQTNLRANVTGLSAVVVTGSIASQTLTLTLTQPVEGLIYVTNNSLATSAPADITFTFNEGYTDVLAPTSKNNQFTVLSINIIILNMILSPTSNTVSISTDVEFMGLGGYGDYTYSILTNNSGASIDASTGVYTSGTTPNVTDTVKVVDVYGNSATATVQVTP